MKVKIFISVSGLVNIGEKEIPLEVAINKWLKEENPDIKFRPNQTQAGSEYLTITFLYE